MTGCKKSCKFKRGCVLCFFLLIFCPLFLLSDNLRVRSCLASEKIDSLSGVNQSFRAGYVQRSFGEKFHDVELYGPSEGKEEPSLDNWVYDKKLKLSTTYDSNLFSSRLDAIDDLIYLYGPTLSLKRKWEHAYLETFYDISYSDYVENQKLSHWNQSYTFNMGFKYSKVSIDISNRFLPHSVTAVGERTELKSATQQIITYRDGADMTLNYFLTPKTTLSIGYSYDLLYIPPTKGGSSSGNSSFSSQTHAINPRISYQWTPKTSLHADYNFQAVDFPKDSSFASKAHTLSVGFLNHWNARTTFSGDVGVKRRDYNDNSLRRLEWLAAKLAVSRQLTGKIRASLFYARDADENLDLTRSRSLKTLTDYYGVNLTWAISPHLSLDAEASVQENTRDGLISHPDPDNPRITFTRQDEDQFYDWGLNLNWAPRPFLSFLIGYDFTNKNSSFKDSESERHKLVGSMDYRF